MTHHTTDFFNEMLSLPKEEDKQKPHEHKPGKFLGQAFARNTDRYECAECGQSFNRKWYIGDYK